MFVVKDTEIDHIYGLYNNPALAHIAVKTLFEELDKDVLGEIGSDFPSFEDFQNSFSNKSFPYFEWCGFIVEKYDLNRLYRQ